MKELVKQLHELSGCSLADCNKAIEICKDIDIAYEFLRLKSQPVVRCHITKFTDSDYLEMAIKNIAE